MTDYDFNYTPSESDLDARREADDDARELERLAVDFEERRRAEADADAEAIAEAAWLDERARRADYDRSFTVTIGLPADPREQATVLDEGDRDVHRTADEADAIRAYASLLRIGYSRIGAIRSLRTHGLSFFDAKRAADDYEGGRS